MHNLLRYKFPNANWAIIIPPEIQDQLAAHAQHYAHAPEAAGQLFARSLITQTVIIEKVTLLQPIRSTRNRFRFNLAEAFEERAALFNAGMNFIGLWHTHPESFPSPSSEDLIFARDHATAASKQLAGILFLIVGTAPFPHGLLVGAHDSNRFWTAEPSQ